MLSSLLERLVQIAEKSEAVQQPMVGAAVGAAVESVAKVARLQQTRARDEGQVELQTEGGAPCAKSEVVLDAQVHE